MKLFVTGLTLALSLVAFARAADIDDVRKAYNEHDFRTAMQLAQPLAQAGNTRAQFAIGLMYLNGEGVPVDIKRGLHYVKLAADAGFANAQVRLAFALLDPKFGAEDAVSARAWAERASAQKSDAGDFALSYMYMEGLGGPQDVDAGFIRLQRAASAGNPLVNFELGKALLVGRGTARDVTRGTALLNKAAAADPRYAASVQLLLAHVDQLWELQNGRLRLTCTSLSCAGAAGLNATRLRQYMNDRSWIELAAKVIEVGDKSDLNYFYLARSLEGLGNLTAAKKYYDIALDATQFGRACSGLFNNCDGSMFPQDIDVRIAAIATAESYNETQYKKRETERIAIAAAKAQEAMQTAASQRLATVTAKAGDGDHESQFRLAQLYFAGEGGVTTDVAAGQRWLSQAAEGGYADAQFDLGQRLLNGKDMPIDERSGVMWLRKAAAQRQENAIAAVAELDRNMKLRAQLAVKARQAKERELSSAAAAAIRKTQADQAAAENKRRTDNAQKLKAL